MVRIQAVAVLERQPDLSNGDTRTEKAVAARRKARCHEDRFVAGPADLEGFKALREIAGPGFTSLMIDDAAMQAKLELCAISFARDVQSPGAERYFIALEHIATGEVVGCVGIKATIGQQPPFFNFRIIREAQSSSTVKRRFDMDVLIGVNDFTGSTEVGSLFVKPEHRAAGVGRCRLDARRVWC